MRTFLTSFMAFCLSLLAGGMVAQMLAVATRAGQEYILVFMTVPLVAIVVTVLFFVPQLFALRRRAVDRTGRWSLIVFAILVIALIVVDFISTARINPSLFSKDVPILAGLVIPSLVVILVQWVFVRWRVGRYATGGVQTA